MFIRFELRKAQKDSLIYFFTWKTQKRLSYIFLFGFIMKTVLSKKKKKKKKKSVVWSSPLTAALTDYVLHNLDYRWQIKNVIFPFSQGIWTPNVAGCRLKMKGPHPQNHMTLQHHGHLTNKKHISTFIWRVDSKLSRVVTWDDGTPPTKSHETSIVWSHGKSKVFYFHFRKR